MLKVYKNIKARRLELHISQQKLAEMVGYTDKSAISHIEKGEWDIPQSKLEAIAKVLNMKPGELLGDTEATVEDEIISILNMLNQEGKEKVMEYVSDLAASGRYAKQHSESEVV
jgi:transcriptional regulator with XRE-family HTH domain